jgi:tRNA modification GTPase
MEFPKTASITDTIAAIATPLGESALGIVRLSGSRAIGVVQSFFETDSSLLEARTQTCHVGRLRDKELIDEAVITIFRAPGSYTGEDMVEISAHGNPLVLQKILSVCLRNGARIARPGEFTERAFLNGKIDLTQAEAVVDLIHAKTSKAQAAALRQLEGRLAEKVRHLRDQLLPVLAHIEVGLDHSDEDHDFMPRAQLVEKCGEVRMEVETILRSARVSRVLREGARVALVGRPNVGKSSLMNALLKTERAIVTPIAGTTRDTIEETLDWEGIPVVLVDTAGIRRDTADPVEYLSMDRTRQAIKDADLVIALIDSSEPLRPDDGELITLCKSAEHLWALTKSDLPQRLDLSVVPEFLEGNMPLSISSVTGAGFERLIALVKEKILGEKALNAEAEWLINTRHQDALNRVRESLFSAENAASAEAFEECVAFELKNALHALGEMIGETTTEDLLEQIFSQFCIGK